MLKGKNIVLGITGSIAVYKACELASKCTQAGANVYVVMTKSATEFVSPLTFRSLTGKPVVTEMWDLSSPMSVEHVALAQLADLVVIAPATANSIAKMAVGIADDMLTCTILATKAPIVIAPAMNANMYDNCITQENIQKLAQRGCTIVEPAMGWLACGMIGKGRLADVEVIMAAMLQTLGRNGDLVGKKIVITAGGTQEPIDAVRHISNRSSGKMGYALAMAARNRGAQVTLISTPVAIPPPAGISLVKVNTAAEMQKAVALATKNADVLIKAAAVADYRPKNHLAGKMKKSEDTLVLELEKTQDILATIDGDFLKVGFAAESENLLENAKTKLLQKKLHLIVANDITVPNSAMEADNNQVSIMDYLGNIEHLPLLSKSEVAERICDKIVSLLAQYKES